MKKIVLMSIIVILTILLLGQGIVKAATPSINITGNNSAKAGEKGSVTINVTSGDSKAGVVSGVISKSENISNITVTGTNGWNLTYNEAIGKFNVVKADGADESTTACITISYTIEKQATGKASITLSDLKITGIDYTTESVSDVTKEITITDTEENTNPDEQTTTNTNPNEETTTNTDSKTVEKTITTKAVDTSVANSQMPKTGINTIVFVILGVIVAIIGIVLYIKYNRMY